MFRPFCAPVKPFVRILRLLYCLSGELSGIFGLGDRFIAIFWLTDVRPDTYREMASSLQYCQTAQRPEIPPESARKHRPDRPETDQH
jgi:hypothetical protein